MNGNFNQRFNNVSILEVRPFKMGKYFIITILSIVFPIKVFAQHSDIGNWFIYFGNKPFTKKWN